MCPAEHGMIHSADPCRHLTVGQYGLTFQSLYMWSRTADRGTPSSDDRFRVDFIEEHSIEAATAALVSKRAVFLPLRGLSLTLPRANACFSQSSSVALRGGASLNPPRNAAITWDMVCPVCCLSCTHTLAPSTIVHIFVNIHYVSIYIRMNVFTFITTFLYCLSSTPLRYFNYNRVLKPFTPEVEIFEFVDEIHMLPRKIQGTRI